MERNRIFSDEIMSIIPENEETPVLEWLAEQMPGGFFLYRADGPASDRRGGGYLRERHRDERHQKNLTGLAAAMPDLILLDYEMPLMDGYLLKTSRRETLLDAIHRFFAESFFRRSLGK